MNEPNVRYQVFISSTYEDLREEREAVSWAIMKLNHIAAGMEALTAKNDRGWKTIQRIIDESDYYVLVLAGRYGSIEKHWKQSWTHHEYEYAALKGLPILAFIREPGSIPSNQIETDPRGQKLLKTFTGQVSEQHLCKSWRAKSDLATEVATALTAQVKDDIQSGEGRLGWRRGEGRQFRGSPAESRVLKSDSLGKELRSFASRHQLKLDVFAYSTETFRDPLQDLCDELLVAEKPAKSVVIRILLKNWDHRLLLPGCAPNETVDSGVVKRYFDDSVLHQTQMSGEVHTNLDRARETLGQERGIKLDFEFRAYPFDPFHKGLLVNGEVGFWNLYPIENSPRKGFERVLDYQGQRVSFSEFRNSGSPSEAEALKSMQKWFDTVWTQCSIRK